MHAWFLGLWHLESEIAEENFLTRCFRMNQISMCLEAS